MPNIVASGHFGLWNESEAAPIPKHHAAKPSSFNQKTPFADIVMSTPPPGIPLSPDQQKVAAHLAKIAIWLGRVTMVLGILLLALVALMAVTAISRIGLRGEVVLLLGVVASVALLFMWQATAVGDAGRAFRELGESPFPGLVALAIGKTARYFSVDALMFWGGVAVLVLTCTFAVVGS